MKDKTSIICIECNKPIKKTEGFIPVNLGHGIHHPNCKRPCTSDKTKMYDPGKKRFVLQPLSQY